MDIKYYNEFVGLSKDRFRLEILTKETVGTPTLITTGIPPVTLEYPDTEKLEPLRGSGLTLNLISLTSFQFLDLHTEDYQKYLVKFYRNGDLYWLGWLDSETYREDFSSSSRYPVEFTASDFNVCERIKYTNPDGNNYTDILPEWTHIFRCISKLGIPFEKVYVGCSTIKTGSYLEKDNPLNTVYLQSANFYDEDGEAMTIREVLETILRPYGLMMMQKGGSLYIYDYNTILNKEAYWNEFEASSFIYKRSKKIDWFAGDIQNIGFASSNSSLEYEEMINNTEINISLYSDKTLDEVKLEYDKLKGLTPIPSVNGYLREECTYEGNKVVVCTNNFINDKRIMGFPVKDCIYTKQLKEKLLIALSNQQHYIKISARAFVSVTDNPFTSIEEDEKNLYEKDRAEVLSLYGKLYLLDAKGEKLRFYKNIPSGKSGWSPAWVEASVTDNIDNSFVLCLTAGDIASYKNGLSTILNIEISAYDFSYYLPYEGDPLFYGTGRGLSRTNACMIPFREDNLNGILALELSGDYKIEAISKEPNDRREYDKAKIKDIFLCDLSFSLEGNDGKELNTDDVVLTSYINKSAYNDAEKVDLCVSSGDDTRLPFSRSALLIRENGDFKFASGFKRAGQIADLEHLLMRTIHSNHSGKRYKIQVDLCGCENLQGRQLTYDTVLPTNFFNVHASIVDFDSGVNTVTLNQISKDNINLSDIPYDGD